MFPSSRMKTDIMSKYLALGIGALALSCLATDLHAQTFNAGDVLVRARAVHLSSRNDDGTGLGLAINDKWLPEVDGTYFFTPNIAAELILTVPQKQTLTSNGTAIGTLKHLPPTLLVQYHLPVAGFIPYVGAGINYTRFSSVDILDGGADIKRNSFGPALQIGADVPLTGNWSLNLDAKKVWLKTDVSAGGAPVGRFRVDPWLVGVGVGYKF